MATCLVNPSSVNSAGQSTLSWSLSNAARMYYFYSDGRTGGPVQVDASGAVTFTADAQDRATWLLYTFQDVVTFEIAFCVLTITP